MGSFRPRESSDDGVIRARGAAGRGLGALKTYLTVELGHIVLDAVLGRHFGGFQAVLLWDFADCASGDVFELEGLDVCELFRQRRAGWVKDGKWPETLGWEGRAFLAYLRQQPAGPAHAPLMGNLGTFLKCHVMLSGRPASLATLSVHVWLHACMYVSLLTPCTGARCGAGAG